MATIYRKGKGWRAQVCVKGVRDSALHKTRQEAAQWALQREAELGGRKLPDRTLADALRAYEDTITPTRDNPRWEEIKLAWFRRDPLAKRRLAGLGGRQSAPHVPGRAHNSSSSHPRFRRK